MRYQSGLLKKHIRQMKAQMKPLHVISEFDVFKITLIQKHFQGVFLRRKKQVLCSGMDKQRTYQDSGHSA